MADPIKLLLLAGIGLGIAWGAQELLRDNILPPAQQETAEINIPDAPQIPLRQAAPLEDYDEIIQRPLFYAGRRTPEKEQEQEPQQAKKTQEKKAREAPKLRLSAIVVDGDRRSALVEITGDKEYRRLAVGDELSDWKVQAIDDTSLTLGSGKQRERYPLLVFKKPPATPRKEPVSARGPKRARLRPAQRVRPNAQKRPNRRPPRTERDDEKPVPRR